MQTNKQNVLVMDKDSQVLKGLVLLLEDMQFNVIPESTSDALQKAAEKLSDCPALLLLPFEFNGESGIELVKRLRNLFSYRIPSILLSHGNGFDPEQFIDEEIVVLSDRISPQQLRSTINSVLHDILEI